MKQIKIKDPANINWLREIATPRFKKPKNKKAVQEQTISVKSGNPYRDGSGRFGSGGAASTNEELYHGTTSVAAQAIEKDGFDISKRGDNSLSDGMFGAGIYLTNKKSLAGQYGDALVKVTINPKIKIATYDDPTKYFKDMHGIRGSDEITKYFTSKGYGGLRLIDSDVGDEIVIFNPKDVVFQSVDKKGKK